MSTSFCLFHAMIDGLNQVARKRGRRRVVTSGRPGVRSKLAAMKATVGLSYPLGVLEECEIAG
jgi:hypothetical protein